jgi:hypothetical protein
VIDTPIEETTMARPTKNDEARRQKGAGQGTAAAKKPGKPATKPRGTRPIVSPKDERGVPYPGDWPNQIPKLPGCF